MHRSREERTRHQRHQRHHQTHFSRLKRRAICQRGRGKDRERHQKATYSVSTLTQSSNNDSSKPILMTLCSFVNLPSSFPPLPPLLHPHLRRHRHRHRRLPLFDRSPCIQRIDPQPRLILQIPSMIFRQHRIETTFKESTIKTLSLHHHHHHHV